MALPTASDNPFPSVLVTETAAASISSPASGKQRLFVDTDHVLKYKNSSGTVSNVGTASGGVATDPIWDAAGDLVQGTGADTAARLAIGASGKVPISNGTSLAYGFPPGRELDYITQTTDLTVTATTAGAAQTFLTGTSLAYDGSTRIKLEFWSPNVSGNGVAILELYDGATDLGIRLGQQGGATSQAGPYYGVVFLTPSNASHQYIPKFWRATANMTVSGNGGGIYYPAFMRITIA